MAQTLPRSPDVAGLVDQRRQLLEGACARFRVLGRRLQVLFGKTNLPAEVCELFHQDIVASPERDIDHGAMHEPNRNQPC